jgi:hypothetical protein
MIWIKNIVFHVVKDLFNEALSYPFTYWVNFHHPPPPFCQKQIGCNIMESLLIFYQKREKLHDEEERKSAWVSQERQKTLDRLRTFKQVMNVWSIYCFSLLSNRYRFLFRMYYNHGTFFNSFDCMALFPLVASRIIILVTLIHSFRSI